MFRSVAAFELRYQLKSPAFWVTFAIFLLLTFAATASDNVQIGSGGNVWKNSPYAIAQTLMVMTVFSVFILTAFVANVVVRDDETGFGPIIHSTRLSRFDYLFGRFTGAFLAGCLLFLSAPLGMIIGAAMPWLDPEVLGPFNLWHYAYVYLLLCVPTLFVTGAGFFAIATATRSMMWTYVGVIVFLVLYLVATSLPVAAGVHQYGRAGRSVRPRRVRPGHPLLDRRRAQHADPRIRRLHPLEPRAMGGRRFRVARPRLGDLFARRDGRSHGRGQGAGQDGRRCDRCIAARAGATPAGQAEPSGDAGWSQLWALARFDIAAAIRSPAFIVLLGIGFVNSLASLWYADESYGNTIHPVTRIMIEALQGAFTIIPLIIAIYYAGELVWRDRDRRMHEIIDSTPAPDWAFVVPKILAISIVLFSTLAASVLAAIVVQALKGYFDFEVGKYLALVRAADDRQRGAVRGARDLHADAGAAQDLRLDADAAVRGRPDHARPSSASSTTSTSTRATPARRSPT